jgi:hypothetical protein
MVMRTGRGGAGRHGKAHNWMAVSRVAMTMALLLVLLGLIAQGGVGGGLLILAGAAVLLIAAILLVDIGGGGDRMALTFQEMVQRRVPFAVAPDPSQRALIRYLWGAIAALVGLGYLVGGLALLAGWLPAK